MADGKKKKTKKKLPAAKKGETGAVTRTSRLKAAGGSKAEGIRLKKPAEAKTASVSKKPSSADQIKKSKPSQKPHKKKTSISKTKIKTPAQQKTIRRKTGQAESKSGKSFKEPEKLPDLPREYGENELLVMVVDPNVIYAAWEVTKDRISIYEGDLHLRIFDVTSTDVSGKTPFFDTKIEGRVGSGFFDIKKPGRKILSEIGLLSPAEVFITLLRSGVVSLPEMLTLDELGIVRELLGPDVPFGY